MYESPNTHEARRRFLRIGLAYLAFFLISLVGGLIITLPVMLFAPHLTETALFTWISSIAPMYLLALPVFLLILRQIPAERNAPTRLRARTLFGLFLASYGVMQLTNLIGVFINMLTDILFGSSSASTATEIIETSPILLVVIFAVIVGPIVEEFMFRGILLPKLLPFGEKFAILATALLFGLFHGNLSQFFYAFALGLILGFAYCKTSRLRYPVLLHMAINFCGSVIPLLLYRLIDPAALEKLDAEGIEMTPELVAELMPTLIVMLGYEFVVFAVALVGICLFLAYFRRVPLTPARAPIPLGEQRYVWLSPGAAIVYATTAVALLLSYL